MGSIPDFPCDYEPLFRLKFTYTMETQNMKTHVPHCISTPNDLFVSFYAFLTGKKSTSFHCGHLRFNSLLNVKKFIEIHNRRSLDVKNIY